MRQRGGKFIIIEILIIAAFIAFMIFMLASGSSADVPMSEIEAAMEEEASVKELEKKTVLDAAGNIAFEAAAVDEGIYYRVDDIMDVRELFIARIEDDDARETVLEAVTKYAEEKRDSFEGYGTDQFGLLSNAVITEKGAYIFFGVSEDVLLWESKFLSALK